MQWLQVTEATNRFTFQIIHSWMKSWPGLTVIPPSEICELFWAIFAFTTPFSSWNMVLQPKFFFTAYGTERSQQALTSKLRQLPLEVFHHKNNTFNFFFRNQSAIWTWTHLKIFFSLKLISKGALFASKSDACKVNAYWLITWQVMQTLDYVN